MDLEDVMPPLIVFMVLFAFASFMIMLWRYLLFGGWC